MRRIKGWIFLGILAAVVVIAAGVTAMDAERRVFSMVAKSRIVYEQTARQLLEDGEIYELENVETIFVFGGKHPMVEFMVEGDGVIPPAQYFGFYYSPDDVPLAFQNIEVPLTEYKENEWEWSEEGDNHGVTKKITECWYYFEAWL